MGENSNGLDDGRDSLHILSLTMVPLKIRSLQKARLIKNSRLEGMIELYSGQDTGSGQIHPDELDRAFDFSGEKKSDLNVVKSLSKLSSYDVYSLRVELRKMGIDVEAHEQLRLTDSMKSMLGDYMHVFVGPLIGAVYGGKPGKVGNYQDLLKLFMSPDQEVVRKNLQKLATMLNIEVLEIPNFLQDYGDVYLSLAYYQFCIDKTVEKTKDFLEWLNDLQKDPAARANGDFTKVSKTVEAAIKHTAEEIQHILEMFEIRTSEMWDQPSADKFTATKQLVSEYQCRIGGGLCAITVKLDAWAQKFRFKSPSGTQWQVEFIMNEMHHGLDQIERIEYGDTPH